jgi:hypothetical protein
MLPSAYVAHRIAGRIRLRIPERRNDEEYFATVASDLARLPGVDEVRVNPHTASVLLLLAGNTEEIAEFAREKQLFSLSSTAPDRTPPLRRVLHALLEGEDSLKKGSDERIDFPLLVFLACSGAAVYQVTRGHALPAGVTLLKYALDAMHASRSSFQPEHASHATASSAE